ALKEKKETIYPGMAIDTTVIGDYPNLRRFIAALEQSRQFLIINSLAFQGEGDKVRRETAKLGNAAPVELSSPDSVPVSLKIELDTYFRRPRATP
ncbi:MAG: GspMb/PilO family protein, partial [Acidobacteriota bacterium]